MPNNEELKHCLVSDLGFKKKDVVKFLSSYLDSIDLVLDQESGHQANRFGAGEPEFDFETIELLLDEDSGCRANGFDQDDTELEYETGEPALEQWSQPRQGGDGEDDTILEYPGIEGDGNLNYPDSRFELTEGSGGEVIASYSLDQNCSIGLLANGPINRGDFETLIDLFTENLESGDFFSEADN